MIPQFCMETVKRLEKQGLGDKLTEYLTKFKVPGDFGRAARLHMYIFDIVPNTFLSNLYEQEYRDVHKYDDIVEGEKEIKELVNRIGWLKFLKALEWYAVKRLDLLVQSGSKKFDIKQLPSLIQKIKAIPKWLK